MNGKIGGETFTEEVLDETVAAIREIDPVLATTIEGLIIWDHNT